MTASVRRPCPPDGPTGAELWTSLALAAAFAIAVSTLLSKC